MRRPRRNSTCNESDTARVGPHWHRRRHPVASAGLIRRRGTSLKPRRHHSVSDVRHDELLNDMANGVRSFSLSSLTTPENRIRVRPYNSLTKKPRRPNPEMDSWRRSWGPACKDEFWAALQSDYDFLMDNNLMESCKEIGRDASDKCDPNSEPTFTDFAALFAELYAWLSGVQEAVYSEETTVADRVAHMERLQREGGRRANFNEQGERVLLRYPELRDEVSWRVAHINSKWDGLLLAMAPAQVTADHNADVEHQVRCLRKWLREMEGRLQPLDFRKGSDWTAAELEERAKEHLFSSLETPGYVGFANLPNQVHRKSVKKGFEFTLMVVGESGLGKSTLVNSLFLTDLYPERVVPDAVEKTNQTVKLDASTVEIEERGVKLRLTVVDTPGYGDAIDNTDCFRAIIQYIDDQFERFLRDESGLNRRNIVDNRIHCCFYFISPFGHGLKPLDVKFMKQLHNKVNIVPVIAKSDVLTKSEVQKLKKKVMEEIEKEGIKIYPLPDCDSDEDEDYKEQVRQLKEAVPFAVCGATTLLEVRGRKVRGRPYPWGVVEVENPDHCDFIKLRTMLITHMQDLQEVTQEVHYENYRSERLAKGGSVPKKPTVIADAQIIPAEQDRLLQEKEAELRRMQEMLEKMQAQILQQQP